MDCRRLFSGPLCLVQNRQLRDDLKALPVCACSPRSLGLTLSLRTMFFQVGHCPPNRADCCGLLFTLSSSSEDDSDSSQPFVLSHL